jgi:oxygen-independent coproporphyrinogen-3 oxidase
VPAVIDAISREIGEREREFGIDAWETVYIGGGTPSLLAPETVRALCGAFRCGGEVTIEANPEDLTAHWLSACAEGGVNRLSLGIQSLHDGQLAGAGRRGNRSANLAALELVRARWKGRLSCDLIAGLPGQNRVALLEDIDVLAASGADHISLYALTIEDGTPLDRRLSGANPPDIPDEDAAAGLWLEGRDRLEERGFIQYEVSNFARPGGESRHNMAYWNLGSWVAAGPGASGTIARGDTAYRYTNNRDIAAWMTDPSGSAEIEPIGRTDTMREALLMGFHLRAGIGKKEFKDRFGTDILDVIGPVARTWLDRGLLADTANRVALTRDGLVFLNRFLADCMEAI